MSYWQEDQLELCFCNFCKKDKPSSLFIRDDGLTVVKCNECGLVYLNPRPKKELIPLLYDKKYFSSNSEIGFKSYFSKHNIQGLIGSSYKRLQILSENGVLVFGKVLEIGCATGEFCHVLHKIGLNVEGLDVSEDAISEARRRYKGINFHVGTIENLKNKYNFIFAYEVIEHLTNPDIFFEKISDLLNKDGIFCLTTPCFECGESIGFENWSGFKKSFEHLYFFSSESVKKYSEKNNLKIILKLYGGGSGHFKSEKKENNSSKIIRFILKKTYLLSTARKIKKFFFPDKHNYQSQNIKHNLLMVLQKKEF